MHAGHRERLRDRYCKVGAAGFAPHELLELLLTYVITRVDVNPIAHTLLDTFNSMEGVLSAKIDELMSVPGVGRSCAIFLSLLGDIFRLARIEKMGLRPLINTAEKATQYLMSLFGNHNTETFYALLLDGRYRLIKAELIASGSANCVVLEPRTIVQKALLQGAASVILAHNHPAGSIEPSLDDINITSILYDVLTPLNIHLVEHYIVTRTDFYAINAKRIIPLDRIRYFAAEREK